jgi:hypothetical protein
MKSFLLAYHGGGMGQSTEEQAKHMAAWGTWYRKMGSAVIDGGNPVNRTKTVLTGGKTSEGGGSNPVSGYTIINASSIDDAVSMAKDCPVLDTGGSVEVCETYAVM